MNASVMQPNEATWRYLVSEAEQNEIIGRLLKQKQEAEVAYSMIDRTIKDIGDRLEMLGAKLKGTGAGGDYRDLLGFLEKTGVGVSRIGELLNERNRLATAVHEHKSELAKLGIALP